MADPPATTSPATTSPALPPARPQSVSLTLSLSLYQPPPPPPSRTKWTRLVHPSVLTGHVSSLQPLHWIGFIYRTIQQNFVEMEQLFDLLDTPLEIHDAPGPLTCTGF